MHTTLLLVRHGETEWNTLGKFQGSQNIPLSKVGIEQAKLLGQSLSGHFDAVYSSPLQRAFDTAEMICRPYSLMPIAKDELTEIHFGSWEGLTHKEIQAAYPEHFMRWQTDDLIGPMFDGEMSIKAASLRAKNCILKLLAEHVGQTIVVVSHGGLIKAALIGLLDWKMTMYHHMALGNTCITTLRFDDKLSPLLLGLNDTHHLLSKTPFSI